MRRGTLIAVLAAVIVLAGGILLLTLLPEEDVQQEFLPPPPPDINSGHLIYAAHFDVDSVALMPRGGTPYSLRLDHSDPNQTDIELIAEDAIFPGMQIAMFAVYSNATMILNLPRVTENADDAQLALYGLDTPVFIWRVDFLDGTSAEFAIGLRLAASAGNYVRKTDSRDVYILDDAAVSILTMTIEDIYNIFFFPYPASGDEYETWDLIDYLLLERPDSDTIELSRRDDEEWFDSPLGISRYRMLQPMESECSDSLVKSIVLEPITNITPERVIEVRPSDLSIYGLADPTRLTITAPGWEGTLLIGYYDPSVRGRYIMIEGRDAVLLDPHGNYGFLDLVPAQLRSQMTWMHHIDSVSSLVFELDGVTRILDIEHPPRNSDEKLSGRLDGSEIGESNTRRLYASALSIPSSGSTGEPVPGDAPVYRFTMHFINGTSQVLELYSISDSGFLMVLDGESLGVFTTRLQIQVNLLSRFEILDSGGDLPMR